MRQTVAKNGKLTPSQQRAVAALLTERDTRAAAAAAKVGYRTLCRWLEQPVFQSALKNAEAAAVDSAIRRLAELTGAAVETLKAEMRRESAQPGERIRAADVVLKRLLDLKQLAELEARLATIEAALKIGDKREP